MDLSGTPNIPYSESERLAALHGLDILDTPAEREFDELTRLAAAALGVASAAVSLIDHRRQWFKSRHGIPFEETPREIAFCVHALAARQTLIIPDASIDPRFASNPLVTRPGGIRFYAGVPLIAGSGHCLGTFCVFDPAVRTSLSEQHLTVLEDLARLASDLIDSRRMRRMGEIAAKVVDTTSDAVLAADVDGRILYCNPAASSMFGRSQDEVLGQNVEAILPRAFFRDRRDAYLNFTADEADSPGDRFVELTAVRADGTEFPAELSFAPWGETALAQGFALILRDISARKALEREREQAKVFMDTVVANLPAMLFVKDAETRRYVAINKAGEKLTGRSAEEMIGFTDRQLFPEFGTSYEQRDRAAVAASKPQVHESVFRRGDGAQVHMRTTRVLMDGPDRPAQYILGVSEDVTQIRQAEASVMRLAHYDTLTGLLNRASYTDRLKRMVSHGARFAMLSIDLDRFKSINDQFGHLVGDQVLAQAGDRLRALVGPSDWVARLGGDEFVVVLLGGELEERAHEISDAIVARMSDPFVTERAVAHAGASVGVVISPDDGTSTAQLRENVDLALYRAKHAGRSAACFFNAGMDAAARDRRTLEADLRAAIAADDIRLEYQPVLAARTGRVTSVEALARWTHAERGPIPPDVFIPLAEECGLIDALGEHLLRRACGDALGWGEDLRVAVNLSPMQFLSGKLVKTVRAALDASGLPARRLQLEVTEGLVIRDVERTFEQLEQLREVGIRILMDDFGVGYSSLSYFQRFHFDTVKIDKSFIDEIGTSRTARAIVQAVVGLGETLGMAVVAEGIETEEQMRTLVEIGCTHLQGYLLSRPLPAAAIAGFATAAGDSAATGSLAA